MKNSGESDQIYVNGVFSGSSTNKAKFSLYVSPYIIAIKGDRTVLVLSVPERRVCDKQATWETGYHSLDSWTAS